MAKVKPYDVNPKEKKKVIADLFNSIERLRTKKEIIDFFLGLFTASEALMIARRIQIAKLLAEGKSYDKIKKELKVSSHTIHRTDTWLHDGDEKYVNWLAKIIANLDEDEKEIRVDSYSDSSLLNKYSYHRFWKDLFN